MKILREVFFAVVLILVPTYVIAANAEYMRISFIEGDVQMKTPEAENWGYASMNSPVGQGDEFWVPLGGKAEIQVNSGTYIRIAQNSALQILSMDKDSLQFYLSQGHAYIVNDAPEGSVTQIDTIDASTRAFINAIFRIDLLDKYTDVAVYKEYVETENEAGSTRVNAGEMVSLGLSTNGEVAPMGQPDEWEKWNRSRNDIIFARTGTDGLTNLPPDLKTYSSDLNNSGKWVQVPEYGNIWTPTVDANWAPYKDGRWIWRGGDYVWVASEPWGWAPYHYGRWAFVAGIGWCWVPPDAGEAYWSPGYVAWVTTGDYVAWVPLAPGEIYYGRGYHGRNSVNIINTNIIQTNITNVYKNVHVNNGVTVVRRNTFATASPRIERLKQNVIQQEIFTKNNISVGTPAIKPTRASYFASPKMIPAFKLPPQAVRKIQVKELRQSRPFIREQNKSVMNPGKRTRELSINNVKTPRILGRENPNIKIRPMPGVSPGREGKGPLTSGPKETLSGREPRHAERPKIEERPEKMPSVGRRAVPGESPLPMPGVKSEHKERGPVPQRPKERPDGREPRDDGRPKIGERPEGRPAPVGREDRGPRVREHTGPESGSAPAGRQQGMPFATKPAGPERGPAPAAKTQQCPKGQHFDHKLGNCAPDDNGKKR